MRIAQKYSHLGGLEFMLVRKPYLWQEIQCAIQSVDARLAFDKVSSEKTMAGKILYSPAKLNGLFKTAFNSLEWYEFRYDYFTCEDPQTMRDITGIQDNDEQRRIIQERGFTAYRTYNQVDFVKDRAAVEVQFGKYFSVQYDLHVKHAFFHWRGDIDVGVEIIPTHKMMSQMSTGVPWYESELANIVRETNYTLPVPVILIGTEP